MVETTEHILFATQWLSQHGYEPHQIAAIIGHGIQESSFQPNGPRGDGGDAHGVFQWNDRAPQLKAFAEQSGRDWTDLEVQLEFMHHELQTTEKTAGDALRGSTNVEEAAVAFMRFERPSGFTPENPQGGHGWDNRLNNAREIERAMGAGGELYGLTSGIMAGVSDLRKVELAQQFYTGIDADKDQALASAAVLNGKDAYEWQSAASRMVADLQIDPSTIITDQAAYDKERGLLSEQEVKELGLGQVDAEGKPIALTEAQNEALKTRQITMETGADGKQRYYDMARADVGEQSEKLFTAIAEKYEGLPLDQRETLKAKNEQQIEEQRTKLNQNINDMLGNDGTSPFDMMDMLFMALIAHAIGGPEAAKAVWQMMEGSNAAQGAGSGAGADQGTPGAGYARAGNAGDVSPIQNAPSNVRQLSLAELKTLHDTPIKGADFAEQGLEFARRFIGQYESNNRAQITQLVGSWNLPWCGGFVDTIYDKVAPGLFTHGTRLSARSYEDVGKQHDAWEPKGNGYTPKPMDTVTIARTGGSGRHVGIVTQPDVVVNGVRGFMYISGNTGGTSNTDGVEEKFVSYTDPKLMGFVNVDKLSRAKGIDLNGIATQRAQEASAAQPASAAGSGIPGAPAAAAGTATGASTGRAPAAGLGRTIILDMGHIDAHAANEPIGASAGDFTELEFIKEFTPKVVKQLEDAGWTVIKTWEQPERNDGVLTNADRAAIQARNPGVPYVSIHADARVQGGAEFVYNAPNSRDQRDVQFAQTLAQGLNSAGVSLNGDGHGSHRENGDPYDTIRGANPNLFFEVGALSAPGNVKGPDWQRLQDGAYQDKIATGLVKGLESYYSQAMQPTAPSVAAATPATPATPATQQASEARRVYAGDALIGLNNAELRTQLKDLGVDMSRAVIPGITHEVPAANPGETGAFREIWTTLKEEGSGRAGANGRITDPTHTTVLKTIVNTETGDVVFRGIYQSGGAGRGAMMGTSLADMQREARVAGSSAYDPRTANDVVIGTVTNDWAQTGGPQDSTESRTLNDRYTGLNLTREQARYRMYDKGSRQGDAGFTLNHGYGLNAAALDGFDDRGNSLTGRRTEMVSHTSEDVRSATASIDSEGCMKSDRETLTDEMRAYEYIAASQRNPGVRAEDIARDPSKWTHLQAIDAAHEQGRDASALIGGLPQHNMLTNVWNPELLRRTEIAGGREFLLNGGTAPAEERAASAATASAAQAEADRRTEQVAAQAALQQAVIIAQLDKDLQETLKRSGIDSDNDGKVTRAESDKLVADSKTPDNPTKVEKSAAVTEIKAKLEESGVTVSGGGDSDENDTEITGEELQRSLVAAAAKHNATPETEAQAAGK